MITFMATFHFIRDSMTSRAPCKGEIRYDKIYDCCGKIVMAEQITTDSRLSTRHVLWARAQMLMPTHKVFITYRAGS